MFSCCCFICEMSYVSFTVTTKDSPRVKAQQIKKGETELSTMEIHQFTKYTEMGGGGGVTIQIQNNQKTINKITLVCPYISITLNANGRNLPIKRHRVAGWI